MATITGTDASDFLVGTDDGDLVNGGLGNDTIRGLGGNDTLNGAEGNDDIDGGDGNDLLIGGDGNDTLQGGMNADTLEGGAGNDVLRGGKGHDSIDGGDGDDTIYSGLGQDTLTGGAGADVFVVRGDDPNFPGALKAPTITDFVAGTDTVAVEGASEDDITAALAAQTTVDGGVSFSIAGATIVVKGTGLTSLTADNVKTVAAGVTPPEQVGETIALTTAIDNKTGTGGNDTFTALVQNATGSTLNAGDQVDGSTGTDTLNLQAVRDGAVTSVGATVKGVEIVNVQYTDATLGANADVSINASQFQDIQQLWAKNGTVTDTNADTLTYTSVKDGTVLGVQNNTKYLNVTATTTGTATSGDTVKVVAAGGDTGTLTINDAAGDGYATVELTTSGAASTLAGLAAGTDFATLKVSGDQALTITNKLANSVKTIDASGNSGAVSVRADASSTLKATGGTSETDKLTLDIASSISTGMAVSGFETVSVSASGASTLDTSLLSGVKSLEINTNNTSALTLDKVAAGTGLKFVGAGSTTGNQTFGNVTYNLATSTGTSDAVAISIANAGKASTGTATITTGVTAAGIESVSVSTADFKAVNTGTLTLAAAKDVTFTGSSELTTTVAGSTALATVDLSGVTSKASVTLTGATSNLTYTGAEGADTITTVATDATAAAATATYNTGAGNDSVTVTNNANNTNGAKQVINLGAGDDTVTVGAFNVGTLELNGGEGTDRAIVGTGVATINAFTGFETIQVGGANKVTFTVASGYADTVEVIDVSGGTADIAFTTAAGGTINLSNFKFTGWTTGTDVLTLQGAGGNETFTAASVATTVIGGAGADTITLGAGNDIVRYTADGDAGTASTLAQSAGDTINSFSTGNDKVAFTGDFLTAALTGTAQNGVNAVAYGAGLDLNGLGTGDDTVQLVASGAATAALADLYTLADLNAAIGTLTNDTVGDERILAFVSGDGNTAIYKFTSVTADGALAANELQLLGTVSGTAIAAGDVQFT